MSRGSEWYEARKRSEKDRPRLVVKHERYGYVHLALTDVGNIELTHAANCVEFPMEAGAQVGAWLVEVFGPVDAPLNSDLSATAMLEQSFYHCKKE